MTEVCTTPTPPRFLRTPPTAVPCPSWCTCEAGHAFDQMADDGAEVRAHVHLFGDDDSGRSTNCDVVQLVAWREGREQPIAELRIGVWIGGNHGGDLTTPDEARRLAAALVEAADLLGALR